MLRSLEESHQASPMETEEHRRSDTKSTAVAKRSTFSEIVDDAIKAAHEKLSDAEISVDLEHSPPKKKEPAEASLASCFE